MVPRRPRETSASAAVRDTILFALTVVRPQPVQPGGGFCAVRVHSREDTDVRRRPGRPSERRHPAGAHRPRRRSAGIPQVVLRVPHPVLRGEGARGLGALPVDGAEPRLADLADDLARHGPRPRERRAHHRRPRIAAGDRGGPRAAALAPRPAAPAGPLQGRDGLRPDLPRQPRRALRPRPVREPAERDLPVLRGAAGPERDDVPRVRDAPGQRELRALRRRGVPRRHDHPSPHARGRRRHEHFRPPVHRGREDARGRARPGLLPAPRRARDPRDRVRMTAATSDVFTLTGGALLSLAALAVSGFLGAYVFGLNPRGPANRAVVIVMIAFVAWAYLVLGTNLIIVGPSSNWLGPSERVAPTYVYFAPLFFVWMFSSVMLFVRSWWRVRKTPSRRMIGIVLFGLILGTVPAAVTELFWPLLTESGTRLGLGSVYTMMWSIFIAYAVARYQYLEIETVVEAEAPRAATHRLERGLNYLVVENGRTAAMGAFREIVSTTPGLCVTGLAPSRVASRF